MPPAGNAFRWQDRQIPEMDEVFLDHAGYFVADLDVANEVLLRLGFSPSAINLQTNLGEDGVTRPSGTSNRLVRLRHGFLEFLAATHDTPLADQLKAAHSRYEGLHLVALSHADLDAQRSRLVASGFDMQPMVHMRRQVKEYGVEGEVAWSVLRTMPGVMPEGRIQFVYPHTPDLSWPPGSMTHPNRAESLTGMVLCAADPAETRSRYGAFLDRHVDPDGVALDRGTLRIVSPDEAAEIVPAFDAPDLPYFAAVTVACADLDETRRVLAANGVVPCEDRGNALWIAPADALGSAMCFHRPQQAPI